MDRISIQKLFSSYGAYLRAKVMEKEFVGWGGSITDSARKAIAEHQELEEAYIRQLLADRRIASEEFKKLTGL